MNVGNSTNAQAMRMLQEMQAMADAARSKPATAAGEAEHGFADALRTAVSEVNSLQQTAGAKADAFTSGEDIPLTEVMVSMQKSRVAFEATKQVRNKLVEAYQAIFNMPV